MLFWMEFRTRKTLFLNVKWLTLCTSLSPLSFEALYFVLIKLNIFTSTITFLGSFYSGYHWMRSPFCLAFLWVPDLLRSLSRHFHAYFKGKFWCSFWRTNFFLQQLLTPCLGVDAVIGPTPYLSIVFKSDVRYLTDSFTQILNFKVRWCYRFTKVDFNWSHSYFYTQLPILGMAIYLMNCLHHERCVQAHKWARMYVGSYF